MSTANELLNRLKTSPRALAVAEVLFLGVILAWPIPLNKYLLVTTDSQAYVETSYWLSPTVNWPMGYGMVFYVIRKLTMWESLWASIIVQLLFVSSVFVRATRVLAPELKPKLRLALYVVLGLTSLPWYASQFMTDSLLPSAALMLAMALFSDVPGRLERAFYFASTIVIATTHYSVPPILTLVFGAAALLLLTLRRSGWKPVAGLGALVVGCWIAIPLLHYSFTQKAIYSRSTHNVLMSKLYSFGLLERFKQEHCPSAEYKLCGYDGAFSGTVGFYLWSGPIIKHLGGWDDSREESMKVVKRVAKDHPGLVLWGAIKDFGEQLVTFKIGDTLFRIPTDDTIDITLKTRYPRDHKQFARSRQQHQKLPLKTVTWIQLVVAILSFAGAIAAAVHLAMRRAWTREKLAVALFLLAFMVANAAVTGILSNPADRYQARVIPLLVMIAGIVGAFAVRRPAERPASGGAEAATQAA
ncbi:MAG: hypothetical protein ACK4N5_06355 [Myxococcales bacterium]